MQLRAQRFPEGHERGHLRVKRKTGEQGTGVEVRLRKQMGDAFPEIPEVSSDTWTSHVKMRTAQQCHLPSRDKSTRLPTHSESGIVPRRK